MEIIVFNVALLAFLGWIVWLDHKHEMAELIALKGNHAQRHGRGED